MSRRYIRESRPEDINVIMKIWLDTNIEAHSFIPKSFWMNHYESVKSAILQGVSVFEYDGEIIGFVGIIEGYIAGIFVKSGRRSEGIGKQLIKFAKLQYEELTLDVYVDNIQAINFYEREGFKVISQKVNEDTGFEEYRMEWIAIKGQYL